MDFKNFIDILTAPKNIGSNKWALNNFSDLKSSNDYLHIIRLRYDNRWLKVYWDGKLKEVEKDNNFYVSTPIKNKVFPTLQTQKNNFNLLNIDLVKSDSNINLFGRKGYNELNLTSVFLKKIKSQLDEGALKNSFSVKDTTNFFINTPETLTLDNIFLEYRFIKNFYNKNTSKAINSLDSSTDL
jgi:hypothetical protein